MFQDKTLQCRDCGAEFVFTAGEQEFYQEKGFQNEPARCPACRAAKKAQRRGGVPRQMYPAVCAACGCETEVPFEPNGSRPVYCRDCFQSQRQKYVVR
ncbi:MAG: zinc-ribbon domain containing protein [Peptococcaceae bacterium]|nr:zinc-ribbon domain containing protein [Peptococcaceae bacterium]